MFQRRQKGYYGIKGEVKFRFNLKVNIQAGNNLRHCQIQSYVIETRKAPGHCGVADTSYYKNYMYTEMRHILSSIIAMWL